QRLTAVDLPRRVVPDRLALRRDLAAAGSVDGDQRVAVFQAVHVGGRAVAGVTPYFLLVRRHLGDLAPAVLGDEDVDVGQGLGVERARAGVFPDDLIGRVYLNHLAAVVDGDQHVAVGHLLGAPRARG